MTCQGTTRRHRPLSLISAAPSKLLSLEEARQRALLASPRQKYIDVGGGPSALPYNYHTVVDLQKRFLFTSILQLFTPFRLCYAIINDVCMFVRMHVLLPWHIIGNKQLTHNCQFCQSYAYAYACWQSKFASQFSSNSLMSLTIFKVKNAIGVKFEKFKCNSLANGDRYSKHYYCQQMESTYALVISILNIWLLPILKIKVMHISTVNISQTVKAMANIIIK